MSVTETTEAQAKQAFARRLELRLKVNGKDTSASIEPRVTLLDLLRERLALTGTKKGCNEGACGACTVLLDGKRVNACMTLAASCEGAQVITWRARAGRTAAAPRAGGVYRARRLPVRLLHAGPGGFRGRVHPRRERERRRDGARMDERQHLPLLGLSADHRRRAGRCEAKATL